MLNNVHGIIFTNESEYDLQGLTSHRSIASVPFGGRYRAIDFILSDMVNAGINDVGVILQQNYQSLLDHLGSGKEWNLARRRGGLRLLPPFSLAERASDGFRGHMDALASVMSYLTGIHQDTVILADGDIILNIDLQEVYDSHVASGADITCVCTDNYITDSRLTAYITADENGLATDVVISPEEPAGKELINIYMMSKETLIKLVNHCASHNLFKLRADVLVGMKDQLKINVFTFNGFVARPTSVSSFFSENMKLLDPEARGDLFNTERLIRTQDHTYPSTYYAPGSVCKNSLISDGCIIEGTVENSIIFRDTHVAKGAVVKNSILMVRTEVGEGANINHVITDKHVTIKSGTVLAGAENYPLLINKDSNV